MMRTRTLLQAISILALLSLALSCTNNVYIDDEDTREDIWMVGTLCFETANEAIEYMISTQDSRAMTEDGNRTVRLMRPVLAEGSDGIVDSSYTRYVEDDSLRGSITVPSTFSGDLCIDFGGYRYDFSNGCGSFFTIEGGDNIYIYNGQSVIFNEASHEPYAIAVNTETVTIDTHLIDDRRTDPKALNVKENGSVVITSSTEREKTSIDGSFNVDGKLSIEEGIVYIDSITKGGSSSFSITGGEIHNPHDYDDIVLPAIKGEEFNRNNGEHSYIHTWSATAYKEEIVAAATCQAEGSKRLYYKCTAESCTAEITKDETIEKTGHNPGTWITTDGTYHWKECTVCSTVIDKGEHTFTDWAKDESNVWHRACEDCGREEEDIHLTHILEHHEAKAATCTEDGNTGYWECSICHDYFSDEGGTNPIEDKTSVAIGALGHEWDTEEWATDKDCHWHSCAREGCDAKDEKAEHTNEYYYSCIVESGNPFLTISHKCNVCERSVSTEHPEEDGVFHITQVDGMNCQYDRATGLVTISVVSSTEYVYVKWYDIEGNAIDCLDNRSNFDFTPDGKYVFRGELLNEDKKAIDSCYIQLTYYKN